MIQARAVHSQADAHRQNLAVSARRPRSTHFAAPTGPSPTRAAGRSRGAELRRRPLAPRLGGWLIAWGIRLGGRPVRTS